MDKDPKGQQSEEVSNNEEELMDRRGFLLGLKKWSKIVIGGALLGGALLNTGTEKDSGSRRMGQSRRWWWRRCGQTWRWGGGCARRRAAWANRAACGGLPGPIAERPGHSAAAPG